MIRNLILDLDGPILDGKLRHYQCYGDILREHGFVPLSVDEYWEMKRHRYDRRRQLSATGAEGIYDAFLTAWLERIEQKEYLALDRLQPQVIEKLGSWKADGLGLHLVTLRNNEANLIWQLDRLNLLPLLDHVASVRSSASGQGKADAVRGIISLEELETALWIGDTEIDIMAARQLGVKVCVVECGLRSGECLATFDPDYRATELSSICFI
jgi:phosphoglycolate phosphatase